MDITRAPLDLSNIHLDYVTDVLNSFCLAELLADELINIECVSSPVSALARTVPVAVATSYSSLFQESF